MASLLLTTCITFVLLNFRMSTCAISVIVIGAGPAGLAAASRLLQNNFSDIKVIEAESRLGGRIHSVEFGDAIIDLGAQWCHGDTKNVVYQLVKDLDVVAPSDTTETFYHSSRQKIDQQLAKELLELFHKIYYSEIRYDGNMGDYLLEKYSKAINQTYQSDKEKYTFANEFLDVLRKQVLLSEGTFSWFDTSAEADFEESDGHQGLNWKGRGFKTLLDVLMKAYPDPSQRLPLDDKIILNKEAIKITWDGRKKVLVECSDKSAYEADYVILTVSLGVLKDRYRNLFEPVLPQEKVDAIEELGIAAVMKVFLYFPVRWWSVDNFKSISLFWSEADKVELLATSKDKKWLLDLVGFYPVENNPKVLELWLAGENIPRIENLSNKDLTEGMMFILNKFLGHEYRHIPEPSIILRSRWYTNKNFRGSYSFQTVTSRQRSTSGQVELAKPLTSNGRQTLLFAGEATSPTHYGTVHGAIETGFREADRIINLCES